MSKKKAVIVSGYFNPIHKGHLECFNNAKDLADALFVIINSDLNKLQKMSKRIIDCDSSIKKASLIEALNNI